MTTAAFLSKPLQGGLFGEGEYALASMACVARGLHAVKYMVIQPRAGTVLAVADEKGEVLAAARRVIEAAEELRAANDEPWQPKLWADDEMPIPASETAPPAAVSRRRREVFERSRGQCFYCETPLQIGGEWHVEHQMPRALGGTDAPLNLVAACARCNLRKADTTALEFIAGGGDR